jgi:hypothetical protein
MKFYGILQKNDKKIFGLNELFFVNKWNLSLHMNLVDPYG